jgi:hypothetical protein
MINIEKTIEALKSNRMDVYHVHTADEAKALALSMIPEGSTCVNGGSVTLAEIGMIDALKNGNYNYVDVTWNDSGEEYRYIYFNMTDKQMLADRELYPHFTEVGENGIQNGDIINFVKYECNCIKNSYFYRNGLILNKNRVKQIARKIEQYKTEGAKSISLYIDDEKLCYRLKKDNQDIIEDIQNELSECEISEYLLVRDVLILFLSTID